MVQYNYSKERRERKMYNVYNKMGILILENIEHWQLIQMIAEFKNEISFKKA